MRKRTSLSLLLAAGLVLSGCSGKSGSSSAVSDSNSEEPTATAGALSGTAAIGAPLSKAAVSIFGDGCEKTGTANLNGVFTVNMGDCQGPYLVKVEGSLGTVYSLATEEDVGQIINASPLTSLVTSLVLGDDDLSDKDGNSVTAITPATISEKVNIVKVIIQPLLAEFGAESKDIMKGTFKANGEGLDRVLDAISVVPAGGDLKLKLKSGTDVTVPTNVTSADAANLKNTVSAQVATISTAMNDLDSMQADLTAAMNLIASRGNVSAYCHSSYLQSGYAGTEGCLDFLDEQNITFKASRPMILERVSADTYWVAFDLHGKEPGEAEFAPEERGLIMQMKKNSTTGKWQLYGNQVHYDAEFYPAVMAIDDEASSMGYYFSLHESVSGPVAYDGKNVTLKFLADHMMDNSDLLIEGTLDEFGQFNATDVSNQLCDASAANSNYSWHCLKGLKADGSLFKGQFVKIVATYPDPSDPNAIQGANFYVQTPKGMNPEVPVPTLTGTSGTVTTGCLASISKASWTEPTGRIRFDYLDPVWFQNGSFYDLGEDGEREEQGAGEYGDTLKDFSPILKAKSTAFNAANAFQLGYQSTFVDIFERQYIRFSTCQ